MSYAEKHHIWQPLAAISIREEAMTVATTSLASISFTDENNDVWHRIIIETDDNFSNEYDALEVLYNSTEVFKNFSDAGNGSSVDDITWKMVTMVGTAASLGLLILATIIGK